VLSRIRAGVLEHGFAKLMREAQVGERMDREGQITTASSSPTTASANAST